MTPALLKQAREALWDVAQELHHIDSGPIKELGGVIAKVEDAASALTAFDSLSDYDKAIHALATYLPDGWVAFSSDDLEFTHFEEEPTLQEKTGRFNPHWRGDGDAEVFGSFSVFKIPKPDDWRKSLRRITHNSDGTVTVERG